MTLLGLPLFDVSLGAVATIVVTLVFAAALLRPERF